jgi:hypothetical protein
MLKCLEDLIIGKKVRVRSCEANKHGDNIGCVCHLIGKIVIVERKSKVPFVGIPFYFLVGRKQEIRRSEVVLLRNQKTA